MLYLTIAERANYNIQYIGEGARSGVGAFLFNMVGSSRLMCTSFSYIVFSMICVQMISEVALIFMLFYLLIVLAHVTIIN